jgi:putative transposase
MPPSQSPPGRTSLEVADIFRGQASSFWRDYGHPHLHCVVSGGGLLQDEARWIASRKYYFLPVRVLSRVFRNKFRALLQRAFQRGELRFLGELQALADPDAFRRFLMAATNREWVVYAKRPFGDPTCVLKYLARCTHRVAISNSRLLAYRPLCQYD